MGEVDMNERIIRDNAFYGHTKKWYLNYLFFMVESSIINSYIIFQQLKRYKPVFSKFREQLIEQLVGKSSLRYEKLTYPNAIFSNLNNQKTTRKRNLEH